MWRRLARRERGSNQIERITRGVDRGSTAAANDKLCQVLAVWLRMRERE